MLPGEVGRQLARLNLGRKIKPGESVAITAGSRGIANIAVITRAIVEHLKALGAKPFIVPAMGSHGGGTARGAARGDRIVRHHGKVLRLPDSFEHGHGGGVPKPRKVCRCISIGWHLRPIMCLFAGGSSRIRGLAARFKAG